MEAPIQVRGESKAVVRERAMGLLVRIINVFIDDEYFTEVMLTGSYPVSGDGLDKAFARFKKLVRESGNSAITLETTGSSRIEGLRACVSLIGDNQFDTLERRLARFREDH